MPIIRTLLTGPAHGQAIAKHTLAAEQSKWDTFSRAMTLILNPADREAP